MSLLIFIQADQRADVRSCECAVLERHCDGPVTTRGVLRVPQPLFWEKALVKIGAVPAKARETTKRLRQFGVARVSTEIMSRHFVDK